MARIVGTVSRGIRAPIIRQGDDLAKIVVTSVLEAAKEEGFALRDRDVVGVTEAVGRCAPWASRSATRSPAWCTWASSCCRWVSQSR